MAAEYLWVEGVPLLSTITADLAALREAFEARDRDVAVVSYPKSGTNWILEIVQLIHTRGDPSWVRSVVSWERSPWLEKSEGVEDIETQGDPRFYTSHLPVQFFPRSFFASEAKCIYIVRNPRDILVSGYHFWKAIKVMKCPESFEEYFEWFLQGDVPFGSWFDHVGGWLQRRGKENFLLISYEELHQDTRAGVERVCRFLGIELSPEELDSVVRHASFQAMKENAMSNFSQLPGALMDHSKACLMRKGMPGDWETHFTPAQTAAFARAYREKTAGLPRGLFPWERPPPARGPPGGRR